MGLKTISSGRMITLQRMQPEARTAHESSNKRIDEFYATGFEISPIPGRKL